MVNKKAIASSVVSIILLAIYLLIINNLQADTPEQTKKNKRIGYLLAIPFVILIWISIYTFLVRIQFYKENPLIGLVVAATS